LRFKDNQKVTKNTEWINQSNFIKGAFCDHDKSPGNNSTYGKLCNRYTVIDSPDLCPAGWHVSANDETDFPFITIL
jgi:hypothetical protein